MQHSFAINGAHRTSHLLSVWVVLLATVASVAPHVSAQQIMVTASSGAPGDPFSGPPAVIFDKQGNLFVADMGKSRVQRIDSATGAITTVVGTGTAGFNGDGIPANTAQINCPVTLAFDVAGSLYIADGRFCPQLRVHLSRRSLQELSRSRMLEDRAVGHQYRWSDRWRVQ